MLCVSCGHENALGSVFCNACGAKLDVPNAATESVESQASNVSADFVGRQREMGELVSALDDAGSGQGRLVMLVGEPGIGKTRTAEEFASYAKQQGSLVLWGRCHEQQGMPPFWPWVQAIRSYVREREPEQLQSDMGAGASVIAEIVPDINELLPDLKPPPQLESPEQARFRLFDAITTFLKIVSAQSSALTLILDNLHWADKPSLLLLEFLSQELSDSQLMVIGTYRDVDLSRQHPLGETLGELTRARLFQRVALRGLSLEDEGQLIKATSGSQPNREFVELVHSRTEGNPLFIGEVMKMLEQEGDTSQESADVRIPEGVREVIGRRLNRLNEECNQALTVASVIGREFEFTQLVRLVEGVSEDDLLESLEEALSARVIEEIPQSVGRYQFTHALVQETLIAEVSLTRRVRLHARIAEALETLYGASAETHAVELAHHFAQAEAVLGTEKLVRYSKLAGETALDRFAYEEAVIHFERASQARGILEYESEVLDEEAADLLFGLARSRAGAIESVVLGRIATDLIRAFDYLDQSNNIVKAIEVASFHYYVAPGAQAELARITTRAIELVRPDSLEAGYILARHGMVMGREVGDADAGLESLEQALTIAEHEGDNVLKARVLHFWAHLAATQFRFPEAVEKALAAIESARQVGDLPTETLAHGEAALSFMSVGDPETARRHLIDHLQIAQRLSDRSLLAAGYLTQAKLAALSGDWETARQSIERVLEFRPKGTRVWSLRGMIENWTGNFEQGLPYMERWNESISSIETGNQYATGTLRGLYGLYLAEIADLTNDLHRLDESLEIAQRVLGLSNVLPWVVQTAMSTIGIVASLRNDADLARSQYASSLRFKGAINRIGEQLHDRILGRMCHTMGEFEDGVTHFEDAIAFCRKANYRPELAWSLHDYADMLLQRHEPGDSEKAAAMLDEAAQISTDLGMRPLMKRVAALKEKARAQPSKPAAYPDGLTAREVEVLSLVAQGKSNPAIADELFISLNTVTRHLSHVYSKTGCANRVEAASYANRHGLTAP